MTEQDDRPLDSTGHAADPDDEALDADRQGGWAGVPEALGLGEDTALDDETPGSQGEIEAGSEGDFGTRDEPAS
jgi:hypothetical protein